MERLRIWYDPEGDFLEIDFAQKPGVFQHTAQDNLMAKLDPEGQVVGIAVLNISSVAEKPLELELPIHAFCLAAATAAVGG